jgi:ribosomal protein S6--L-glutamate ligase
MAMRRLSSWANGRLIVREHDDRVHAMFTRPVGGNGSCAPSEGEGVPERTEAGLHVGILVERRYRMQAQPAGLSAALEARGHSVRVIVPRAVIALGEDWAAGLDVVVARGRSLELLSCLASADACGIPTLNRRVAVGAVHNKADMAAVLAAGGVAVPPTFLGSPARLAGAIPADCYPLILKPVYGDNGRGLAVVGAATELARIRWPERAALAQRFVPSDGHDLKLYGIGDQVWAVRKRSPLAVDADDAQSRSATLTPELEALARRCRELFGLELYGVDCVETPDGPLVIEVNDFPNYTDVPDADDRLAARVEELAEARR